MLNSDSLPPRPDAQIGEPRPPRAPVHGKPGGSEHDPKSEPPRPPDGQGPTLEHHQATRRAAALTGIVVFVLLGLGMTLLQGLVWMHFWWMWLGMVVVAVFVSGGRREHWSAGADWLQDNRTWVSTYDLVLVKGRANGWSADFELKDSHGRKVIAKVSEIQHHRALWDLVYNGILHSIANGADTNALGRSWLKLNESEQHH